jgi:hypothetical protein
MKTCEKETEQYWHRNGLNEEATVHTTVTIRTEASD